MRSVLLSVVLLPVVSTHPAWAETDAGPPGVNKGAKTQLLETGAKVLQTDAPVDGFDIHLVGIHPMKNAPHHQMDVHHFCRQVNQDFAQCALFDGDSKDANLNGIEYIISEKLFETLPKGEKQYWHPHNYEILSGTLVAPGIPQVAEKELMQDKINSYGKTWHTWNTGTGTQSPDELPLGEPKLAWSLNRDGEADPNLLKRREERLGIDHDAIRENRGALQERAHPQRGVDALKGEFGRETQPIDGVEEKPDD